MFGEGHDVVAHKLDVLRRHCEDAGTDYDAIEKTVIVMADPHGRPRRLPADDAEGYAALGVTLVTTGPTREDPVGWTTDVVEKVVPRLAEL